jgi:antitoxin (DNA-binding transcriptional repressor) of toxin-antitoxin stability system
MRFVSIKELSRSPSRYVNMATEGECVIITRNGKPRALLAEMHEEDIEDFILARHLDLEGEFRRAQEEHAQGKTASAEELLARLDEGS